MKAPRSLRCGDQYTIVEHASRRLQAKGLRAGAAIFAAAGIAADRYPTVVTENP